LLTEGNGAILRSVTKGACDALFWTAAVTALSFKHWLWLGVLLLVAGVLPDAARARERGPRVEVVCPQRPIPFPLDKHTVLAYELHITNFDDVPLALKRIRVFSNTNDAEGLLDLAGQPLYKATEWIGGGEGAQSQKIEPGSRVVVYLWVELPAGHLVPGTLRHQIVFSSTDQGNGQATTQDTTLENFPVEVSRNQVPVLEPPFNGGTWLAGDAAGNDSAHRRTLIAIDGGVYLAQRFAIDWIKVGPNGDSHHDGTDRNENWWGYGEPALAVGDGEVVDIVDGIPENVPRVLPSKVTPDNIAGNHLTLHVSNLYVTYAHLQRGSVKVHVHDQVHRGTVLALLGNSGQATAPHLHLQVTDRPSVLESEGVPFMFETFTYLGLGSSYELDKHLSIPWKRSAAPDGAVLEFPPVKQTRASESHKNFVDAPS